MVNLQLVDFCVVYLYTKIEILGSYIICHLPCRFSFKAAPEDLSKDIEQYL